MESPVRLVLLLLLPIAATIQAGDDAAVHPACFEVLSQSASADKRPVSIDLDACSARHRERPSSEFLGLTRYERPPGDAGERRGTLGYERLEGPTDRVLYRLEDNAGGSGVFSSLVIGREQETAEGRRLTDIRTTALGDRCHLGAKWAGTDTDGEFVAAVSLTPAAVLYVLAAPDSRIADSGLDRPRVRYAFGDAVADTGLTACPSCCAGEAVYGWAPDHGWQLQAIELDSLEAFAGSGAGAVHGHLREYAEATDTGYRWSQPAVAAVRRALVAAHPDPAATRRLQHALRALGFYWLAPVDGVSGPRTEAALRAWQHDSGGSESVDVASISEPVATRLVLEALQYDGRRLHPVDETARDPGFAAFTRALQAAIDERDEEALVALSAADIMLGFGGGGGHDDLREWLDHAVTRDALWEDLDEMLALGAVRTGGDAFCVPWLGCLPGHVLADHDPFATVIATDPDARLLAQPAADASPIRALDYDVLRLAGPADEQPAGYYRVRDVTGQTGFVAREAARFMIDTRMEVVRQNKEWRIQSIVSGD